MGNSRPPRRAPAAAIMLVAAMALALLPASAIADSVATTEPASQITSTSADLNGVARPSEAATYQFQYWTATNPSGTFTSPAPVTSQNVSTTVNGLLPATTYSFHLIVVETYQEKSATHVGATLTFTTPGTPGTIATTGQATSVTTTTAELNGVSNTTSPDSTWYFEWGPTTAYGEMSAPQPTGSGFTLVSAKVKGLTPRTRYHFRLVVLQSNVMPNYGADSSFVTAHPSGRAALRSHRLKVRHGSAAIPFKCSGQTGDACRAKVSLTTRVRAGKHSTTVGCGSGRLDTSASRRSTVHVKLAPRCDRLLKSAKKQRLGAKLRAVFSTHQRPLRASVTLVKV